jgi:WD40 repeat protein/tetratricopeptide (TPR) repeat protein
MMTRLSFGLVSLSLFFISVTNQAATGQVLDSAEVSELGHAAMSEGDLTSAAAWYLRAASIDRGHPERSQAHALRLRMLLNQLPALVQVFPAAKSEEEVCDISVTPDGKHALIPIDARSFSIVNTESGRLTDFQVPPRADAITSALLDREGQSVWIKQADGRVFHVNPKREVPIYTGFDPVSSEIGRSPCGRFVHVVSKYRNTLTLFHAGSGEVIKQIDSRRMGIFSVRYAHDVARVAVARSELAEVYELPSGQLIRSAEVSDNHALCILSDDGNELIYYRDKTGFLVDLTGQSNDIKKIDFPYSPEFMFGSGSHRHLITIDNKRALTCDLDTNEGIKNLETEVINNLQRVLAITQDDALLLSCRTHVIKRDQFRKIVWLAPLPFPPRAASIDQQNRLLVVQDERNNILVWDLSLQRELPATNARPRVEEIRPDFLVVSGEQGQPPLSLIPFANPKDDTDWHWSPKGKFLCMVDRYLGLCGVGVKAAGGIRVWDVVTGRPVGEKLDWETHLKSIHSDHVAFSPNGSNIALHGTDHEGKFAVLIWDFAKSSVVVLGQELPDEPKHIAFSSDGKALLTCASSDISVRSVPDGKSIGNWSLPKTHTVVAVAASQGGKKVAVLHDLPGLGRQTTLYDTASGTIISRISNPGFEALQQDVNVHSNKFVFTGNDQYLISVHSDGMGIWQTEPLAFLGFQLRHTSSINDDDNDSMMQGHPSVWDFTLPASLPFTEMSKLVATQTGLGLASDMRTVRLSLPQLTTDALMASRGIGPRLATKASLDVTKERVPLEGHWWSRFENGDYAAVVKLRPECRPAWLALANDHRSKKEWSEAAEAFLQSDRLFPDGLQESYYQIHESLCRSGRFREALAIVDREVAAPHRLTKLAYLRYWLVRAKIGLGSTEEALSEMRKIAKSENKDDVREFEEAFGWPNVDDKDADAVARAVRGLWQLAKDDKTAARKTLDEAVAEEQFRDQAFAARAAMKMQLKEWTSAITDMATALEKQPNNQAYRLSRLECAVATQNWETALEDIQYLQAAFPSEVLYCRRRAELAALRLDIKGREVSCRDLIGRFGNSTDAASRDSAIWECLRHPCVLPPKELLVLAEKLHADYPDNQLYVETLILAQYRAKQFKEIVDTFAKIPNPNERLVDGLYAALAKVHLVDSPENRQLATTALDELTRTLPQDNWNEKLTLQRYLTDAAELSIRPSLKP